MMDSLENPSMKENVAIPTTQQEVVDRLKALAESEQTAEKQELDMLKQVFYKIHKAEVTAARAAFIENGGNAEDFLPAPNVLEDEFKAAMNVIKKKRADLLALLEQQKADNLQKKLDIIERIRAISATPEEANQYYKEFKELQNAWKEIKPVPAEKLNELWKNYQLCVEQYYDQLKLNNEFREYDFKKNLEIKTALCEAAEKLAEEEDVISAFQKLQNLHQEYKETGPVANELRDSIWSRFKAASTIINKKHQDHFEAIKNREKENLEKKTAICEKIEAIDIENIAAGEWDNITKSILELQQEWRTIGFAPQKMNVKIFERFRQACDRFFNAKAEFFKKLKEEQNNNISLKTALCEQVEALKDSEDWKATGDKIMKLQKEWKNIGQVPKKVSEALWQRFITACDYFFERKNNAFSAQRNSETENLKQKNDIIEQLKKLAENEAANVSEEVKKLTKAWSEIGHVPFKEKDALYEQYHKVLDIIYSNISKSAARKHIDKFKNNLKNNKDNGHSIERERDRLMKQLETKRNEIKTYENNLGFLSSNSKKGNSLISDMNKKIEKLKDELKLIKEKIDAVNNEIKK